MSGFDIATNVFKLLNVPSVKATIDGGIYKFNRPINSAKRDIVISVPEYNTGQLNTGYIDINIHVPNLNVGNDQTNPDLVKMQTVVDAILPLLSSSTGVGFSVVTAGVLKRENNGQWYANIRVSFEEFSELAYNIELWSVNSTDDGFGGVITTKSLEAETKASRENIGNGTQLNINVGRYEFNLRCDWVIPSDVYVAKNYHVHYNNEVYVINGISPKGNKLTQLSTVKCDDFYGGGIDELIINAMPAWADKPYIIDTTQW